MTFRTIDENATNNINKYGIRNSSFADIANAYNAGGIKGVGNSLSSFITSKDLSNIKEFNRLVSEEGVSSQTAWYKTMQTSSNAAKELFDNEENLVKSGNSVVLSEKAISTATNTMTFSAKAGQVSLKGLALAGNMVVGILAGFVISKAIEGLDNLVHAADNAKESAEGFASSFSSMNDEFSSNDSKLSDLQKQYDELSKGVNSLGENVSLTTDQYDEYKQVVSEISDMMPSLLARYDDEGNKIGFVQGKLSNLNAEYDKYKKNKAIDLVNGENDSGDSIKDVFDNYQYQTAHTDANGNVVGKRKMFGDSNYEKILALQSEIDSGYDGIFGQNKLTNEDIEKKTALIQKYQSEIDASVSAIQNALSAIAQSGDEYYKLSDQEQQFLDTYINSLSQDFIDENNLTNETNARTFINNLINDIESGKPEIMKAYNDLFSFNIDDTDLSPEEVQKKVNELIQQLAKALGEDNWQDLKIRLGFGFVDDNVKDYEDTINRFNDPDKIKQFFSTEGINTSDEVKQFNDLTNGINDADKAIQKWSEHKKEANEPTSFKQAWKDLDNADDDSDMKNTKKDLTTLAESGKLTRKTFEATEGAKTWLEQIGIDADVAIKKINDLVDNSKQLNSLKSSIKSIQDAYADKRDNGVAGADTLSGMESEFGKLKSWDDYKSKLGSTTSSLQQCRDAQNKLATEYVNSNDFLAQLTEENKDYYTSQLKDLGIKNAQEVVTTQLENKAKSLNLAYSALSKEQKKTVKSGEELAEMSGTDIAMLLGEANGSKKARIELAKLAYQTTNWADLDATQTIEQLNNIAKAAGIAANNISLLQDVNNNPSKYQGSSLEAAARANGMTVDEYSKKMAKDQVGNKLNKKGKKTKTKIDIDLSLPKVTGSGSGSSSSSSNKVFDWIEVRLKRLEDKVKKTVDNINDYATKKTKNNLFEKAKSQYNDLLKGYETAAKKYKKKLDRIKLSSSLKKKIQSGDYSIQTIKSSTGNEKTLDAIDKYQEYWDKYTSAKDNILETKKNKRELIKKQLEDDIADFEDDLSLLQYEADKTQSQIEKNETKGFSTTKKDYKEQISNSQKQIDKWNDEKKAYQSYLKANNISKTSDEYQDIKQKIRDIDKNISDAEKNQLEWNKSISELPYQNLEKFKNVLDAISSRYEKIISFWESQGHTKNESQITKQISIGLNELSQLKKERDEKWNQINKTLSDKGLNSSQNKQFKALYEGMREGTITVDQFYKSISKLGISKKTFDSWDGLRDKLQEVDGLDGDILDKQAEIENNYDDLLTPWINSIQDLIDKINDLNDAQSKAVELEKLQQALQSVKQNKKNLIYHEDYGFNYEANNSAVKEAQDNLDDYYNQEQLDTLNKILDWLNDHKDDMNFFDKNGKPLYKTVDEAVKAVTKGMTEGMSESVKKMFDNLTFSIDKNGKITASVPKYVAGTKYAKGGMSIVGEKGAELRLLNSGDQILPHDLTENLWKFGLNPTQMILDNIQIPDISNLVKNTGGEMVNNNVSIGTVTLPNINDLSKANDVFNALAGLSSYALQQANKR